MRLRCSRPNIRFCPHYYGSDDPETAPPLRCPEYSWGLVWTSIAFSSLIATLVLYDHTLIESICWTNTTGAEHEDSSGDASARNFSCDLSLTLEWALLLIGGPFLWRAFRNQVLAPSPAYPRFQSACNARISRACGWWLSCFGKLQQPTAAPASGGLIEPPIVRPPSTSIPGQRISKRWDPRTWNATSQVRPSRKRSLEPAPDIAGDHTAPHTEKRSREWAQHEVLRNSMLDFIHPGSCILEEWDLMPYVLTRSDLTDERLSLSRCQYNTLTFEVVVRRRFSFFMYNVAVRARQHARPWGWVGSIAIPRLILLRPGATCTDN
jgi:hypothetical protein